MREMDELFAALSRSSFRSRFTLTKQDRNYVARRSPATIRAHARDFVQQRLAPAEPEKDGKQTPTRGHPVFVAQHATGTCCRKCLLKWHGISMGRALSEQEVDYVVQVIDSWISRQLADHAVAADNQLPLFPPEDLRSIARMTMDRTAAQLRESVTRWYGVKPDEVTVIFSPYRICPLGAHIDHQWGQVTAMALDHGVLLAFAPIETPEVKVRSLDFDGEVNVRFDDVSGPRAGDWGNYVRGAVLALQREFALPRGFVGATAGRVAEGGLSSSAAVGVAYLLALEHVNQLQLPVERNIALVRDIENGYLGLRIGILDQSAILLSRLERLTLIDCADVTYELIERPANAPPFSILIAFSGLRKSLAGTDYNRRVAECAEAARVLLHASGRPDGPPRLRHVTAAEYRVHGGLLAGPPARRAAHFFSEMERVQRGVAAWRQGDMGTFGELITASGRSSIDNYECGAPPLIDLYRALIETTGVLGARFSGAGFRGCCLALVNPEQADEIARHVHQTYVKQHPDLAAHAWTMLCQPDNGARFP